MDPMQQAVNPFQMQMEKDQNRFMRHVDEETNALIVSVFSGPQGQALLDRWDDVYLRQPTCPPGCVEGYGYKREGENAFIIKIRRIVNTAKNPRVTT